MAEIDSETELEARLGNWRTTEEHTLPEPRTPTKLRKRKKRSQPPLTPNIATVSPSAESNLIPDTSVAPEVESAALSRTLLRSSDNHKWSPMPGMNLRVHRSADGIGKKQRKRKKSESQEANNAAQLVERYRHEVGALGAAGLQKRERRAYDDTVLDRLGFCKAPNQKMPLTLLERVRRKEKEQLEKDKAERREQGLLISTKRKKRRR